MFFTDAELTLRKRARLAVPPPVPETGWRPPQAFPELRGASLISFDVETFEEDLDEGGPGWARGRGNICGIAVAAVWGNGQRGKWYFPIRHHIETDWNMDARTVLAWLKEQLETPIPKTGANLIYDTGWLSEEGIHVGGMLYDVQFAEALIDNDAFVALEILADKYLDAGKTTSQLYEWCARAYGGKATDVQRANIYRAPPRLVGPYGEDDADLPIDILEKQWPILESEGLLTLFHTECKLIPLLIAMRRRGVPVNLEKAELLYNKLGRDIKQMYAQLREAIGFDVNVNSADDIAKMCRAQGIDFPTIAKTGNPSFRKEWLKAKADDHPSIDAILSIRESEKIHGTFLRGYVLERNVNGLIHCQLHPLKNDNSGAKTGRFAGSDPNMQNIPIRTELGVELRKCFEPRFLKWRKIDYSQIEYRMLAHFATDDGDGSADKLRYIFNNDPKADYHIVVQNIVKELTGLLIERRPIKNLNFGLLYGQGLRKLIRTLGVSEAEARAIMAAYFSGATYVKPTMAHIADEVQAYGYITTIAGRRTRFNLWEPAVTRYGEEKAFGLPYHMALREYGSFIKRAYDYRGVNYKLQGSAADVIKEAMVAAWESGVFNYIGVPLLQVHDELDFDVYEDTPAHNEAYRYLNHVLENTRTARVPIRVDSKDGPSWGDID